MDYADNFTGRYKLTYRTLGRSFSNTWRYAAASGPPDAAFIAAVRNVYMAMAPLFHSDFVLEGASFAPAGSNIFLPATLPAAVAGTGGGAPAENRLYWPEYIAPQGRTDQGQRARIQFAGVRLGAFSGTIRQDYRVLANESALIPPILNALVAAVAAGLVGSDGTPINWYAYLNIGNNSYLRKKARAG